MRKPAKKVKINIQKGSRIIDSKILPPKGDRLQKTIALAALFGFLVGGGILGYFFFGDNPLNEDFNPEIIVPEEEQETAVPQEATTTPETVEEPAPPQGSGAGPVVSRQVLILDTPTGFLNVRTGPGTNFAKLTQVKPGESYELVSEDARNGGWYEIKLDPSRTGWVTKRYAEIK